MKERNEMNFADAHERRKRRRFYLAILSVVFAIYLVLLGGLWIILKSPVFLLKSISLTGNETTPSNGILDVVRGRALQGKWRGVKAVLGFGNMLTWPSGPMDNPSLFLPRVKNITIENNYASRSIVVHIEERVPYGIWCLESQCWWFDDGGFIFRRAIEASGGLILTVHDHSQKNLGLGLKILPDVFIANAFSVFRVLEMSGLGLKDIALQDLSLQELEVNVRNGPALYFSLRFPADNDLAAIQNFAAKPGFDKLQYLDFRVENRVYYK